MSSSTFPLVGNVSNVTIGPSQVFVAPYGTAVPGMTGSVNDFGSPFIEPGFTDSGVEWDYTPTFTDIKVDEKLAPVKKIFSGHKLLVMLKMAEPTLANMAIAIGASTLVGGQLQIGSPLFPPEFVLGFIGPAPGGKIREAIIFRCVSIAAMKQQYHRKGNVITEVQLEALSDPAQTNQLQDLCIKQDF